MSSPVYSGFASQQGLKPIYDREIIKQDLLNQIYTRKGERLMDPVFGCIVWDLLFENKNESVKNEIRLDLQRIIESEPRVTLQSIQVIEEEHGYIGFIEIYFKDFRESETLKLQFNERIGS